MTVRLYRATDASAPVLNGSAGTMINLLAKCLVNGYGSKSPAGWTVEYTDLANRMVFRAPTGHRRFLRVDDDIPSLNRLATVQAYNIMSGVDTGEGLFPLLTQSATGIQFLKSDVEDGTNLRDWILLANEKIFYLIVNWNLSAQFVDATISCFGEYYSFNPSDAYNTILAGKRTQSFSIDSNLNPFGSYSNISSTVDGTYTERAFTQIGSSVLMGKHGDSAKAGLQFPNPTDGGVFYAPICLTEPNVVRGILPGIWHIPHNASDMNHGDTFDGVGVHAGKTFMICKYYQGVVALEISDTW